MVSDTVVGIDLVGLARFFAAHVPGAGEDLSAELIAGGRSNLTYRVTDGARSWVPRRPPLGGLTPSAHDMKREYRVTAALADSGVPVPHTVALCEDPAVIAEGIHARHRDGLTVGQGFETVGSAVPGLAALGLRLLAGGEITT